MKTAFLLIICLILANCEIRPSNAQNSYENYNDVYNYKEEIKNGMTYGVWYVRRHDMKVGYAITVVNLTKDKLEIELMRAQLLNELKKK